MVEALRIEYLADCPAVMPHLENWFLREWAPYYSADGPGDAADDLRSSCNRRALPITLVALKGDELCATGALKTESVATHKHLGPWVAALLVTPKYRRQEFVESWLKRWKTSQGSWASSNCIMGLMSPTGTLRVTVGSPSSG